LIDLALAIGVGSMIILKHLTVERFRLFQVLDLHFPQQGSILIQGPNEAGKSALIESIYFALYGESLAVKRGKRSLDDLILYNAPDAVVCLVLSIGATELTITRTLLRKEGQHVSLVVRQLGMPDEEPITDLAQANQRIIAELGGVDSAVLRNSGLITQKSLALLETISGEECETTVRKSLGIELFLQLTEQFQIKPEDDETLQNWHERLQLSEMQARIPQIVERLNQCKEALDAVQVHEHLDEIDMQKSEIDELSQSIQEIQAKRQELKNSLARVNQLKRADGTLKEIIASYEDIADAQEKLPELEKEIEQLEHREREELPRIETRVNELSELTRSFGTLQRMSNDLLDAVDTIKGLEQEQKQYNEVRQDLQSLNEQIADARERLRNTQQSWEELEDKQRERRPQLEARLQRLKFLSERLVLLKKWEERYSQRLVNRSHAEENLEHLKRVQRELQEAENAQEEVEQEERQTKQQVDSTEATWRSINIHEQLDQWQRLKELSDRLSVADQDLSQAHQQQALLTQATENEKSTALKAMSITIGALFLLMICLAGAFVLLASAPFVAIILFVLVLAGLFIGVIFFSKYRQARQQEASARQREQEGMSQVGMRSAARENARAALGNPEALHRVENDIRALGGKIPASVEEARQTVARTQDHDDPAEIQQRLQERKSEADAVRERAIKAAGIVTDLRKEHMNLEDLRKREQWDTIEEALNEDYAAVERMQQEVTLLAGQEDLPMASINARLQESPIVVSDVYTSGSLSPIVIDEGMTAGVPSLESMVESTIEITEQEIASLDTKLDATGGLAKQIQSQQDMLSALLEQYRAVEKRNSRYRINNPETQLERAREQQAALRSALQSLQESLRQRVKGLGVVFGQAAIGSAETAARKQLEELHITLGNKMLLQEQYNHYTEVLKTRKDGLTDLYKQLSKISNSIGSWIVPLNPFAEALAALRTRCQKEIEDGNESGIQQELERLQQYELSSKAKTELCRQEIENARDVIDTVMAAHGQEGKHQYQHEALVTTWPLLRDYTSENRQELEQESDALRHEQEDLERQVLDARKKLGLGEEQLDLEETRTQVAEQERVYQTKKYGNLIIKEVEQRLLRKVVPQTEYYMRQILPLLTSHRYHDVTLSSPMAGATEENSAFQIQVWDAAANTYLSSSDLSGGVVDQLSLSLRLAFSIAILPRDLNATLGFIVLDEPISAFDRGRAKALVDVVTGSTLNQHFEQIFLISNSGAFDAKAFTYHLLIENGSVIENDFPLVLTSAPVSAIDIEEEQQASETKERQEEEPQVGEAEERQEEELQSDEANEGQEEEPQASEAEEVQEEPQASETEERQEEELQTGKAEERQEESHSDEAKKRQEEEPQSDEPEQGQEEEPQVDEAEETQAHIPVATIARTVSEE
jgi:DNA repair exonuclease SbcCD ATPase subunit